MGCIEINGNRLTGSVNSAEQAAALKEIIEQALGGGARYRATEIQSLEQLLGDPPDSVALARSKEERDALAALPEVQARVRELIAAHYEDWATQPIPALGGRTPLEAVEDADGREKVEALVRQMERDARERDLPVDESIVLRLRERLGLRRSDDAGG